MVKSTFYSILTIPKISIIISIIGGANVDKPIMIFQKKADKTTNKMIIPKAIIQQWGNEFIMEIFQDKIILKPMKKGE